MMNNVMKLAKLRVDQCNNLITYDSYAIIFKVEAVLTSDCFVLI
jgi:hypothetical protein